ncbi:hypothetical protein NPIL_12301 [Nephila pilipes]|uniref:Uncharacterized protein n=1 Tax=Nephila pilipes TaxID=299642 RepID=A0A8X6PB36_NEPPI|nr:hypothetical protein NPIL_12301 [Nephila pilipes]
MEESLIAACYRGHNCLLGKIGTEGGLSNLRPIDMSLCEEGGQKLINSSLLIWTRSNQKLFKKLSDIRDSLLETYLHGHQRATNPFIPKTFPSDHTPSAYHLSSSP